MAYTITDTPDRNGRTYDICPNCEDGRNDGQGHLVTYSNGYSYCVKCGTGRWGKRSLIETFHVTEYTVKDISEKLEVIEGTQSSRYSSLERFTGLLKDSVWDCFQTRDFIGGDATGYMLRKSNPNKASLKVGGGVISCTDNISPNSPIYVVEGPYDVLSSQHVSANGLIHKLPFHIFQIYELILCPDGDIWDNSSYVSALLKWVKRALSRGVNIQSIIKLPSDKDPKDVQDIMQYSISIREFLNTNKRSLF